MRIDDQAARRPAVNLTPIVDVVFLLLTFFMLASTFANFTDIDLVLGGHTQGAPRQSAPTALLSVRGEGRFAVNGASVPLEEIGEALARALPDGEGRVLVRPAGQATAQDIVLAVERAQAAKRGSVILAR